MSDAAVSAVLHSRLDNRLKRVAVAFAHHANHKSGIAWCGIETVARYWGVSARWVQIVVRELERLGFLVLVGDRKGGRRKTAAYRVEVTALDDLPSEGRTACFPPPKGRNWIHPFRVTPKAEKAASAATPRTRVHRQDSVRHSGNGEPEDGKRRSRGPETVKPCAPEHQEHQREQKGYPAGAVEIPSGGEVHRSDMPSREELFQQILDNVSRAFPGANPEELTDRVFEACGRTWLRDIRRQQVVAAVMEYMDCPATN